MFRILARAAVIALTATSLAGCVVNDPYYYDGYGDYYDGYSRYDYYRGDYYRGPYYNYRKGERVRWRDDRNYRRDRDRPRNPDRNHARPAPPRAQPNYIPPGYGHREHINTSGRIPPPILAPRNIAR